jgi:hypothetical protein
VTRRKQEQSRQSAVNLAVEIAGTEDTPLDVLLRMMRDPTISNRDRIEIAKICLPFIHPRMAQLDPSAIKPEDAPIDIHDAGYVHHLIRLLAFSLSSSAHQGRELPRHVWDLINAIPRGPHELKTRPSGKPPDVSRR